MTGSPEIADREAWPALPWPAWNATVTTLHLWSQIVGKIRMELMPPAGQWWHVPLYVTARGLGTRAMPYRERSLDLEFDFIDHRLVARDSSGRGFDLALEPSSLASFHAALFAGLGRLGIEVTIWPRAVEIPETIWLDRDRIERPYEPAHAHALWRALVDAQRVMSRFAARFAGRVSPVHFFWGSFDLAVTRFSGRRAPLHPGGVPNCADWVMQEAYSHEVSSAGWWPGGEDQAPSFYAYQYPIPDGYGEAAVNPAAAHYDATLGEFVLPYEDVRTAADPDAALFDFLESSYQAGARLAGWDEMALVSPVYPAIPPPHAAWSTALRGFGNSTGAAGRGIAHRARRGQRSGV